ncbi:alpha-amylase 3, chloroplastic isoform X2 [Neltuma alba]|uniref:alpha-amylase 3, chloroplastic isoform X2 n=1 Tax=Neltuma alba TaxID=207710 RepID=UPI0010A52034|nr:alpha-amylase 3, chloroplastic isoform X2 [Prosopis alba]
MSTVSLKPLFHLCCRQNAVNRFKSKTLKPCFVNCSSKFVGSHVKRFCNFRSPCSSPSPPVAAASVDAAKLESFQSAAVFFDETFPISRTDKVEGKIFVRLDQGKDLNDWELTIACSLPGKWILHWGVSLVDDVGSEWDQPPRDMIPPGSVPIKDYAIETPMKTSSTSEGDTFHEVRINIKSNNQISAINFVLKDEETGAWYQQKGRDFKVPLIGCLKEDANIIGPKKGFSLWPEATHYEGLENRSQSRVPEQENHQLEGFYVELPVTKEVSVNNSMSVSVRKCSETAKNILYLETDLPGDIVLHWGVCRDDARRWEVPPAPHPPETEVFKDRALRTKFQPSDHGRCSVLITLGEEFSGFLFVLKINENAWLNSEGDDFYVPLSHSSGLPIGNRVDPLEGMQREAIEDASEKASISAYTDGIINEIRNLVTDISSERSQKTTSKEAQESILQEIERLAAEAYGIFRGSVPTFPEETIVESETLTPPPKICSGTGTGYEILCQGFNWESHKSGRWYTELKEKAAELASLGFTVIWLPPPTESVSPEGYMPKDLYNLNSRYGSIDELKDLVKRFHEVGIKVLGDAVLNHRCAHSKNQNGIWNIFGGRLNWDERAVVSDDPHFQGRGNKSSGDNFHAAPNIDHSQEFVRKDLKEWLRWLREEIGYDGWRLDFVRGFWGGYVKDYVDASEPYFAVGEYWDSLSYTYGEMDHNQDAHRQRIVDWINATSGTAGAFDVTTKGILHSALQRCEYWRLSDQKGKPPGVVGWWPSRAVTFIENHDTGSTQGHWRFPSGKEMQGYAYILTHPGTPTVFFDHMFSHYYSEIEALVSIRKRNKIHCRSTVRICKAERDVYAAIIDDKIAMKIGPGHFEPPNGSQRWSSALEGRDYKIWEAS